MEEFARGSAQLFGEHEFLFGFKMTEMLDKGGGEEVLGKEPLLSGGAAMTDFISKIQALTALGESLLEEFIPIPEDAITTTHSPPPPKQKLKKHGQILHFVRFLKAKIPSHHTLIDVGSGVGHLVRELAKSYPKIIGIEQNPDFIKNYPAQVEVICTKITKDSDFSFVPSSSPSALISLHGCGDLCPDLLRAFVKGVNLHQLALVGCCYHKMSEVSNMAPMSALFSGGGFPSFPVGFLRVGSERRAGPGWDIEAEVERVLVRGVGGVREKKKREFTQAEEAAYVEASLRHAPQLGRLLLSHSHLQRLVELFLLLDRVQFLREWGWRPHLYSRILPESLTPHGEMRLFLPLYANAKKVASSASSSLTSLLLTMPKERPHLPVLQASRKLKKKEMTKYPPGSISLQVLGNSLYLFTDQSRYLFNCAEGTQRLAHEHKQKLAKLDHIFLTSGRWERVGGLLGVALTVQDIGVERIWVHGPPGINRLFSSARRFIILKDLEISTVNTTNPDTPPYSDHILTINYINVGDGKEEDIPAAVSEDDTTDYYSSYRSSHNEQMIRVKGDESSLLKNVAVQYGIHLKGKEGTLLIDKCVAQGVPPGPLLGRLKAGEDITLEDGRVVRSQDVRGGDCDGAVVLVVDCPSVLHLPNLLSSPGLAPYYADPTKDTMTQVVVHFTPLDILRSAEYSEFLGRFGVSTQHLVINEGTLTDAHEAVHRMQTKLNLIEPVLFPLFPVKERASASTLNLPVITVVGQTGMRIGLRGKLGVEDPGWSIDHEKYRQELLSSEEFTAELDLFKETRPPLTAVEEKKVTLPTPHLLFLGTGSSIPNKTRNVSSFYLDLGPDSAILFDCGEGSLSQLERFPNFPAYLAKLKVIWISHLHADHHLGLFSFLRAKPGLIVIAPKQISSWVHGYGRDFEPLTFDLLPATDFLFGREGGGGGDQLLAHLGLTLRTCFVRHCPNAFGVSVSLTLPEGEGSGWKVTYSGDTMPCKELVELGQGSDLLIHEATMEDGLEEEALIKMHSTVGQAIEVGRKMGAGFTILTHFSQRYSKVPILGEGLGPGQRVGVAFDGLQVGVGAAELERLAWGGGLGSVLTEAWKGDVEDLEGKMRKRVRLRAGPGPVASQPTINMSKELIN